jgi:hypothetical protein
MLPTKTKNSKIYIMPKFNANIKFKLSLGWFKYMDIKILDNNKMENLIFPHILPPHSNLFYAHYEKNNTY